MTEPKKSLSSILKSALEAKKNAKPEKKKRGKKNSVDISSQPTTPTVAKPKARRSSRSG
jgi:hypothetical protein